VRISYRWSSGTAVLAIAMLSVIPPNPTEVFSGSGIHWDPCSMWEQMPQSARLATLVLFSAALAFLVQGFRNRSAPRWLAVAGLIALPIAVQHRMWWIVSCYGPQARVWYSAAAGAVGLMFLHHIIQRPRSLQPQTVGHDGDAR